MVTIPIYQRDQILKPIHQQGVDVQASPEAFGADIGRGLGAVAAGLGDAGNVVAGYEKERADTAGRDRFVSTAEAATDLAYNPATGLMVQKGRNAVDGAAMFRSKLDKIVADGRAGLSPAATQAYDARANTFRLSMLEQSIKHVSDETKNYILDTKKSTIETFSRAAVDAYRDPNALARNMDATRQEVASLGEVQGWSAETIRAEQAKVDREIGMAVFERSKTMLADRVNTLGATIDVETGTYKAALDAFTKEVGASVIPPAEKDMVIDLARKEFGRRVYQQASATDPAGTAARLGVVQPDTAGYGNPSLPAGMRNNNPGNIKFVGQGSARGVVGPSQNTDQGDAQAVFETPEAGMQEAYRLALRKYDGGKTTARELIAGTGGWTPGNDQAATNIAATIGIDPDDDLNLRDPNDAAKFLRALVKQEHGQASNLYPDEMIRAAVTGAAVEPSSKSVERVGPDVPFVARGGGAADMSGVKSIVTDRFRLLQNQYGAVLRINSGHRDEVVNKRVGGAGGSQHLSGNALDIDVSKLSKEERVKLIGMASAIGFTGIGVYDNALHLDAGNRRAWGPDHGRGSLPAWAESAIKSHEAGQFGKGGRGSTPADLGGLSIASPGTTLDPRYEALSFDERLDLSSKAMQAADARQKAQAAERKQSYTALVDRFELRTLTGDVTSEAEILSSPDLLDSDQSKLLRTFREQQGKATSEATALRSFIDGDLAGLNPLDATDRGTVDKAFNAWTKTLPKDAPAEAVSQSTEQFVRQTKVIPTKLAAALVNSSYADTVPQLAAAMGTAGRYIAAAPVAFQNMTGGAQLMRDVAGFNHLVNERGFSAEVAAARLLQRRSPEFKRNEAVLGQAADKATEALTISDLTGDAFDTFSGPGGEPGAGVVTAEGVTLDTGAGNALLVEYREAFREGFIQTNGDAGEAKARAVSDLKRSWGVSNVSGSPQMMKLPPERFYPPIGESFDYLREDAMATARDFAGPGAEVLGVTLKPCVQPSTLRNLTAEDVRAGRPPRYSIGYVVKRDGFAVFEEVPTTWAMPPEDIKALTDRNRAAARADAEASRTVTLGELQRSAGGIGGALMGDGARAMVPAPPPAGSFVDPSISNRGVGAN